MLLPEWESFYVILGSSAAVLTGLVFVAITLAPEIRRRRSDEAIWAGVGAFHTPTVVHLGAVLIIAALLTAPWHELSNAGATVAIVGLAGILYALLTLRRLRRLGNYQPEIEDWLWYTLVPLVAYTILTIAALLLPRNPTRALFGLGAVALLLLLLGLRNAWDLVTYTTAQRAQQDDEREP